MAERIEKARADSVHANGIRFKLAIINLLVARTR